MNKKSSNDSVPETRSNNADPTDADLMDVRDLTYQGGYAGNPREILTNPAVTPEMQDDSHDDRGHFAEQWDQNET